jgi:ABC-type transport system involved in multi-copper enzyme maturation permease subunit
MNPSRIYLLATHTLRDALHQRVVGLMLLLTLIFAVGILFLQEFNFGSSELKFIVDLGLGALGFFGSLLAIFATVQAIFSEIEGRADMLLFSRPVGKTEFIAGKFLGLFLLLALYCLMMGLTFALVLWSRESALLQLSPNSGEGDGLIRWVAVAEAIGAQWLKSGVLIAAVFLVCSMVRGRTYAMVCACVLLVAFHSVPVFAGYGQGTRGVLGGLLAGVAKVLPDFQRFDLSSTLFAGVPHAGVSVGALVGYACIYIAGFTGLATYALWAREP